MTKCDQILEDSSVPGCPLPRPTKSHEGVLNRPKGTKRDRPDAAAGGEAPTATYRRKRRCVDLAGPGTAEITKPQAFSLIPREHRVKQGRIQKATSDPNPTVLGGGSSSPSTTGPSTSAVDSTSRSPPPAASQNITTAQEDEEDESELPSLESLLGLDPTHPHSDSEDALNQESLTKSVLQIQRSAEVPGLTSVSIQQELSDCEFNAQFPPISEAREARRLAAFAPEDRQTLTPGSSSTPKQSRFALGNP
jgi:hypothetical protein